MPSADPALLKVTAFVTCEREGVVQLLVFRHPLAGVQLPAGTVEPGEDPSAAALREVAEETGLRDVHDPVSLGSTSTRLPADRRILLRDQVLSLSLQPGAPSPAANQGATRLKRGLTVELLEGSGERSLVRHDVRDLASNPQVLISRREGWVETIALGSRVVRHFIHLRYDGRTPAHWTQEADGHTFTPFWTPLVPAPSLCQAQQDWLSSAYAEVLRLADRRPN